MLSYYSFSYIKQVPWSVPKPDGLCFVYKNYLIFFLPTCFQYLKKLVIKMTILVAFFSSKSAEFLHVAFISAEKHCPVIVFAGLLLVFEK